MLVTANSRSDVRALAAKRSPAPRNHKPSGFAASTFAKATADRGRGELRPSGPQPTSKQPAPVQASELNIFVPKPGSLPMREWFWKEMREGGYLQCYLEKEKHTTQRRMRRVARRKQDFQQNNKSEYQLKAVLDARTFFRFKQMDPHFFEDDTNLKKFLRDNPEARPWRG